MYKVLRGAYLGIERALNNEMKGSFVGATRGGGSSSRFCGGKFALQPGFPLPGAGSFAGLSAGHGVFSMKDAQGAHALCVTHGRPWQDGEVPSAGGPKDLFEESVVVEVKSAGQVTAEGANAGSRRGFLGILSPTGERDRCMSRRRREARNTTTTRKRRSRAGASSPRPGLSECSEPFPPD